MTKFSSKSIKELMMPVVVCLTILIALGYGWVMNIIKIINSDFTSITGMLVMRCISIFVPPLGSILGYF